jgi:hypothetical protein
VGSLTSSDRRGLSARGDTYEEGKALSEDIRDLEQNDEPEEQDEVEAHKFALNDEPDDDFEAHIKLN